MKSRRVASTNSAKRKVGGFYYLQGGECQWDEEEGVDEGCKYEEGSKSGSRRRTGMQGEVFACRLVLSPQKQTNLDHMSHKAFWVIHLS